MLENKDVIAQPTRGRSFPITFPETVKLLHELGFSIPISYRRLNVTLKNPETTSPYGSIVAALYPAYEVVIYSVSEDFDNRRGRVILESAFRQLAEIEKDAKLSAQRRVTFQAYLSEEGKLIITMRIHRARFSTLIKPKFLAKDERVVRAVDLI